MKPDTVSLREIIIRKRYDKERYGNPRRFDPLWKLVNWGFTWFETPEGDRFWRSLCNSIRLRFLEAGDIKLQNKSWR